MYEPPPYRLTRHAKNRLRRYRRRHGLTEQDVVDAIVYADYVEPDPDAGPDHYNAWQERDSYWIRVSFVQERPTTVIVTVTVKESGPGDNVAIEE